ncbi:O-methyltransferase [Granulibacter bethesdensis]|uniref:O-methyltransferase n=1 Tax=Granulibacter bethesdensis TaxID=364410 RepID=A0AAN0RF03_9PROT|nr:methyltransferase [Granulibacter bethesdensis]AHJ63814.1 O-methyltransferase [Granulibacter bethesdensis]APH57755.1 O-methyltransferase [Granulibacter bethesdensis]
MLDAIGFRHGTDKSSRNHDFLNFYDRRFNHLRKEKFLFLEIGVYEGQSLSMWREYFENATILGIDINQDCMRFNDNGISVRIGDSSNVDFLFDIINEFGKPLLVLDDGSHRWDHQISAFQILFPILLKGGYYVVEDLDTSFRVHLKGGRLEGYSRISAFDYLSLLARRTVADFAFDDEPEHDLFIHENYRSVSTVEFARRTCVISKKTNSDRGPV